MGYIEKDNAIEPLEKYISCFNTKEKKGENLFKYAQEQEVFRSAVDALSNYGKKVLPFLLEMYKDKLKVAIVSEVTMVAILGSVGGIDVIDVLKEKVKSEKAMIVGDSKTDILAAKNSKIFSAAVLYGFRNFNLPSRFLNEVPHELYEHVGSNSLTRESDLEREDEEMIEFDE